MKNIIKVSDIEVLPDIRPLIALDLNGNLRQYPLLKPGPVGPPNDEIWYTATEKITPTDITVFGANYLPEDSTFVETTGKGILKFDGDITSIGRRAFYDRTSLTSITIPASVTNIGSYGFAGCTALTAAAIPNSVTSIEYHAFDYCPNLTSIIIPNSVRSIESGAFEECRNLSAVTIPSSVTSIGDRAFGNGVGSGGVSPIFDITFLSTTPVSLVYDDQQIKDILGNVNYYTSLAIYVPEGYESIYAEYDAGWEALAPFIVGYVPVVKTDTIFTYSDSTTSTSSDKTISQSSYNRNKILTSVEIGTKATSIGERAFSECYSLTSIEIPNSVTSIGNIAFFNCGNLTSVTIPNSVTSIGQDAFAGCTQLSSVTLSNKLTSIGDGAFDTCSLLPSITIPSSVTSIGSGAFRYAGGHTEDDTFTVILESTTPMVLAGTTTGTYDLVQFGNSTVGLDSDAALTILVPSEGYQSYISNTDIGWVYYRENIQSY